MITTDDIIADAEQRTGLKAALEPAVRTGLEKLVDALNREAPLTERGWQSVREDLVSTLANRLRVEDYLVTHPELLARPVEKPLFVFGLPRTGTTLVINLLHEDPARRSLLRWEAFDSVPPPKAGELSTDPRCVAAQAKVDMALKYAPQIAAIHYEDADSPTECQFAMTPSFCAQVYEALWEVPSYRHWFLYEADYLPAFRYHRKLLQLLQADAPGRWTLKNPWHPLFLDALTTVYPDAQLVMTHRDPVEVVGSACSLIKHVRAMMSDKVDLHYIGESMVDTFEHMVQRTIAFKEKHGHDAILDLQYDDVMRDPLGQIRKVYHRFAEPLTPAAQAAMHAYLAHNPKGKHGKHEYSLEEYGLSKAQVRARFSDYCRRFNIPCKD